MSMTETIEVTIEFEVAPASGPNPNDAPLELRFQGLRQAYLDSPKQCRSEIGKALNNLNIKSYRIESYWLHMIPM